MNIILNGEKQIIVVDKTISSLIEELGLDANTIACELNGTIIARKNYPVTRLADGDSVEIVNFVGGG